MKAHLALFVLLLISCALFAASNLLDGLRSGIDGFCAGLTSILPIVAMTMIIAGGVVYGVGQLMGAETRARYVVWATACIGGALMGVLITVVTPTLLTAVYGSAITCSWAPGPPPPAPCVPACSASQACCAGTCISLCAGAPCCPPNTCSAGLCVAAALLPNGAACSLNSECNSNACCCTGASPSTIVCANPSDCIGCSMVFMGTCGSTTYNTATQSCCTDGTNYWICDNPNACGATPGTCTSPAGGTLCGAIPFSAPDVCCTDGAANWICSPPANVCGGTPGNCLSLSGICGTQPYTVGVQQCCNAGSSYWLCDAADTCGSSEGVCISTTHAISCGGISFDPANEQCCSNGVGNFWTCPLSAPCDGISGCHLSWYLSCGPFGYDPATQWCCSSGAIHWTCDRATQICSFVPNVCEGNIISMPFCGGLPINLATQECCTLGMQRWVCDIGMCGALPGECMISAPITCNGLPYNVFTHHCCYDSFSGTEWLCEIGNACGATPGSCIISMPMCANVLDDCTSISCCSSASPPITCGQNNYCCWADGTSGCSPYTGDLHCCSQFCDTSGKCAPPSLCWADGTSGCNANSADSRCCSNYCNSDGKCE